MPARRRRGLRPWTLAAASLVVGAVVWFSPDAEGYLQGRIEASSALAAGRAELRTIGLLRDPHGAFDAETGLFYQSLG